jgi:nucleotide-binding universal stress UspA family protein
MPDGPVLCGIAGPDGPPLTRAAAAYAAALESSLVLAHAGARPHVPDRPHGTRDERLAEAESFDRAGLLSTILDPILVPGLSVERVVEFGDPPSVLRELAEERAAALIIVGRRRLGVFDRAVLGSTSSELARRATCPVLIVPEADSGARIGSRPVIVCGVDASNAAEGVALTAAALAERLDGQFVLVHVDEGREDHPSSELVQSVGAIVGEERLEVARRAGDTAQELLAEARDREAALVLVGSRGFGAVRSAILGSVSSRVLKRADRPIAVVPPPALRKQNRSAGGD